MKGMVEVGPGGVAEAGILPAMLHPEDVSMGQVMRARVVTAPATASLQHGLRVDQLGCGILLGWELS